MSNDVWHVALEPGTAKMQDVIVARMDVNDIQTLSYLLSTDRLKAKEVETADGGFLLMYAGEHERPFPSVMIWRVVNRSGEKIIKDMRPGDAWIIEHVWREWLMPEAANAEYVPPGRFLLVV